MDLLSDVPVWRVHAQSTSGKFSSYLVLLQFANDMSMRHNAQNMVLQSQGSPPVCRKPNRESTSRYGNRKNGVKVACNSFFNVLPPTSSDFIIHIISTLATSVPDTLIGVPRTSTRWEKSTLHGSQSHWGAVDTPLTGVTMGTGYFPGIKRTGVALTTHIHLGQTLQK